MELLEVERSSVDEILQFWVGLSYVGMSTVSKRDKVSAMMLVSSDVCWNVTWNCSRKSKCCDWHGEAFSGDCWAAKMGGLWSVTRRKGRPSRMFWKCFTAAKAAYSFLSYVL